MPRHTQSGSSIILILAAAGVGAMMGAFLAVPGDVSQIQGLVQPIWISLAIYFVFNLYWSVEARNTAPTKSSESPQSYLIHCLLINVSMVLLFLRVPGSAGRWLPAWSPLVPLGIAIEACFFLLAVWARRHLGRNWSGGVAAKVEHELVRSGPYRLVRHPIYTAILGMYIGIAVTSGEWHAMAGVFLLVAAYCRKIRLEEQVLHTLFGAQYDEYRRNSWALIPGLL